MSVNEKRESLKLKLENLDTQSENMVEDFKKVLVKRKLVESLKV